MIAIVVVVLAAVAGAIVLLGVNNNNRSAPTPSSFTPLPAQGEDWPMYMNNVTRNSWAASQTIDRSTVSSLRPLWISDTHAVIVAQPTVAGGAVYIGNWAQGANFFKLDAQTGSTLWGVDLGYRNVGKTCDPPALGVSSGAAVYSNTVYVGGGDNWFYALSAADGTVLWRFNTAFTDSNDYTGNYNWASPLVYQGAVYVGVASLADCPLVQGRLLKLDANSGALLGMFKLVPDGHLGAGVWTSPAIDPATNSLLITTGNHNSGDDQPYAEAVVQLDLDLTKVIASWRVPEADRRSDTDWGGTLDVFQQGGHSYAATVSKNGKLYVFDTARISSGPMSVTQVAAPNDCPQCGAGDLSSPAFDASSGRLYVAGPRVRLNGAYVGGTVGAFDPTSSNFLWRVTTALDPHPPRTVQDICEPDIHPDCPRTPGVIIAPVIGTGGVVGVNTSWETQLRDANNGQLLYSSKVVTNTAQNWQVIYGGSAFAEGKMFVPVTTGRLLAYAPGVTRSDTFTATTMGEQWHSSDAQAGSAIVGGGQLQLASGRGAGGAANFVAQWPLGGDAASWAITTSLHFAPSANYQQAGLAAYQDGANQITFARVYSDGNYLAISTILTGSISSTLIPDNPQQHPTVYLRLGKSYQGDDLTSHYTAAYSYDNANWITLPVTPAAYLGLLQVGLYAASGDRDAPPAAAGFGGFQISPQT
jgi:outer membrane protein assembly factor BamB